MNIRSILTGSFFLLAAATAVHADKYVRFNQVGYDPASAKRIVIIATEDCSGLPWSVKDASGSVVASGTIGKSLCGKGVYTAFPYNYEFHFDNVKNEGSYTVDIKSIAPFSINVKKDPFKSAIQSTLHWLRVTRSGSYDAIDHGVSHLGDTASKVMRRSCDTDTNCNKVWYVDTIHPKTLNVVGGWYDAGDYIKFTLTASFTAYMILRSYEAYPEIFEKHNSRTEYVDVLDEAKWGLDWLMKTMPDNDTNEFVIEVASEEDHNIGDRLPEYDTTIQGRYRPALSALSQPQMGLTAAALALGADVFGKLGKNDIAAKYKAKAELIYRRAISKDALKVPAYLDAETNPFYQDLKPEDDLELAATELYRVTGEKHYLDDARHFASIAKTCGNISWADMNQFAHLRLYEIDSSAVKAYVGEDISDYIEHSKQSGNIWSQPVDFDWACLYNMMNVASTSIMYEKETGNHRTHEMVQNIVDYLFGTNSWGESFVALKGVHSIEHPNSLIYRLQCDKFPEGAIAEGPSDIKSHTEEDAWFGFDPACEPTAPFNTGSGIFYDQVDDYVCMETCGYGVAEGLFLLTLMCKTESAK